MFAAMENYSQDTGPAATSAGQNGNELTLDPGSYSNWIFVGEGNANTVFANSGPSVSSQSEYLLEIVKGVAESKASYSFSGARSLTGLGRMASSASKGRQIGIRL
jgi:hypothetical protein